jgi:hypothetical protein
MVRSPTDHLPMSILANSRVRLPPILPPPPTSTLAPLDGPFQLPATFSDVNFFYSNHGSNGR